MHFMQLLKSLDELLYEVMSWLVFFPLTLWRTLTQPITMMEYADSELHDPEEQQYEDALSPPLFLLLAILITQAISMSVDSGTNIPPLHSRGQDSWWNLDAVVATRDTITAQYRLNGLNKPKLSIDRRSGRISIRGASDYAFSGSCDTVDSEQRRF
ncbi:hypothetical protein K3177_12945 [Qipengyuania sp. GH25]|uniref:Uncharacterized protein n=1 Tax=Qipengyuania pacifica TaxID=2860199 RepID=A0ABS7JJP3_9SPHN|nr:hypothetical protein [Qipengyuania aerophila]MBX7489423.1 hypothetical protein [Qipengyuania aerophila]